MCTIPKQTHHPNRSRLSLYHPPLRQNHLPRLLPAPSSLHPSHTTRFPFSTSPLSSPAGPVHRHRPLPAANAALSGELAADSGLDPPPLAIASPALPPAP